MQKLLASQLLLTIRHHIMSLMEEIRRRPAPCTTGDRKEAFPKRFEKRIFFFPYQNKLYALLIDLLSQQCPLGSVDILSRWRLKNNLKQSLQQSCRSDRFLLWHGEKDRKGQLCLNGLVRRRWDYTWHCVNNTVQLVWSRREGPSSETDVQRATGVFFPFRKWQINQEWTWMYETR